ncbi:helix-turn-helix domain-containing protein [Vibrio parahaemolyticus]|nr:helix-turn-helix transcriptional regulator [Vibrio parahaemolyticus]EIA1589959.1 helix-turn-helix transcriptional regulator [Vibrio parahaemolyticus]EIA1769687.1 helix-turn-helix transcriptional regulator [Vibrio parahaemolyticus]EJS4016921.1 helix-turn-helix transcriptional regulator [Vibrio parahaemolyticus]HBC3831214.1 helix-turn-helix transcriptional regulator [Vibrio parahaemolyticus]
MASLLEEEVRKALNESNLSNSEIARRCKVARSTVGLWKNGQAIRSDNLSRLCTVLGINQSFDNDLRPIQTKLVRLISSMTAEDDDVLVVLEKLLIALRKKS